jgi:uncharacterized protein YaeQ
MTRAPKIWDAEDARRVNRKKNFIWDNIEPELMAKLADSANKRVSEVLRLNGNISKY